MGGGLRFKASPLLTQGASPSALGLQKCLSKKK